MRARGRQTEIEGKGNLLPNFNYCHCFIVAYTRLYESICPSVCSTVHPSVCPSVCLSVRPSACLSVGWSVCLSICHSICPSIRLLIFLPKSPYPPVRNWCCHEYSLVSILVPPKTYLFIISNHLASPAARCSSEFHNSPETKKQISTIFPFFTTTYTLFLLPPTPSFLILKSSHSEISYLDFSWHIRASIGSH